MFLTPEEIYKKKQVKKFIVKFIMLPLIAVMVGGAVALLGNMM